MKSTFWCMTLWSLCLQLQDQKGIQVQHQISEYSTPQMHFTFVFKKFTIKFTSCICWPIYETLHHLHVVDTVTSFFSGQLLFIRFRGISLEFLGQTTCPGHPTLTYFTSILNFSLSLVQVRKEKIRKISWIRNLRNSAILGKAIPVLDCGGP
jgi:hypothetical protein